jgi:SAM-dependent methyltransferase
LDKRSAAEAQQQHYEAIHDDYEAHYYDAASMAYRERFMYRYMYRGIDLAGKDVADLAAGSGYNSLALRARFPGVRVTGFDLSSKACTAYAANVGRPCTQFDLMEGRDPGQRFDAAIVVGGLHHCVSNLRGTFATIASLLRPGGLLLVAEPNREFVLERLRQHWYRIDRYFDAETERALEYEELDCVARPDFERIDVTYLGGPGYFLILNSLVTRVPRMLKTVLAPLLLAGDAGYNWLPGKRLFPYFVARWRRR